MYRSRRMTDGSLKLTETARTSRSYTEMTSTLPWHQSVTAFCQWTIFRGSYDAFRRSVCSMYGSCMLRGAQMKFCPTTVEVSSYRGCKHLANLWLAAAADASTIARYNNLWKSSQ